MKYLVELSSETIWIWRFLSGSFKIMNSISYSKIYFILGELCSCFRRNWSILPKLSNLYLQNCLSCCLILLSKCARVCSDISCCILDVGNLYLPSLFFLEVCQNTDVFKEPALYHFFVFNFTDFCLIYIISCLLL